MTTMKRIFFFAFALFIAAFVLQTNGFAKQVSGTVTQVDANAKKLTLSVADTASGVTSDAQIWVREDASYSGIVTLSELKSGDRVLVVADQDEQGNWKASQVIRA